MSTATLTIEVPDIGDFDDVPIIEILVSAGDTVAVEDPLVDARVGQGDDGRARAGGRRRQGDPRSLGDQVSQGSALMTIEGPDAAAAVAAVERAGEPRRRGGAG